MRDHGLCTTNRQRNAATKYTFLFLLALHCFALVGQERSFRTNANALIGTAVSEGHTVGIAAGFTVDGAIRWCAGAGHSDLANGVAFDSTTTTRIASITKVMTAIAIMQLVEQGRVDLDVPVQTYLPTYPKKKEGEITVRRLLQHTAGVGGYKNNKEQENTTHYATLADAVALFQDRDLLATPGEAFHYSTYGYVVLGLVIEQVSGMAYGDYLRTHIWDPAGMAHTGVEQAGQRMPNASLLYHRNAKDRITPEARTDLSDRVPGGGVYSTVGDLLRFGDAVLDERLIKRSTFRMMVEDPKLKTDGNGYGLGWYLYGENPMHGNVVGHNGTQTGASTFLMLLPERKTTVVVLSNTSGAMRSVTDITIKLFDEAGRARAE